MQLWESPGSKSQNERVSIIYEVSLCKGGSSVTSASSLREYSVIIQPYINTCELEILSVLFKRFPLSVDEVENRS